MGTKMPEEFWILEKEPIRVSFDTKGYSFYKGGKGLLGSPVESYLRLIAVKKKDNVEISSVSDLIYRVVIKSPQEALEFVRLFTSIETHYLFPKIHYIEPVIAVDTQGLGEYSGEYRERMNLEKAKTSQEKDYFVIERNLLDRAGKLFRAIEHVGRDGAYSLIKKTIIDDAAPISYPIYQ
jgi:hypothetical protein